MHQYCSLVTTIRAQGFSLENGTKFGLRGIPGHTNQLEDEAHTWQTGFQHFEWTVLWLREGSSGNWTQPQACGCCVICAVYKVVVTSFAMCCVQDPCHILCHVLCGLKQDPWWCWAHWTVSFHCCTIILKMLCFLDTLQYFASNPWTPLECSCFPPGNHYQM